MNFQPVNETENQSEQIESRVRTRKRRGRGFRRILLLLAAFVLGLFSYNLIAVMKFLDKANQNQFSKIGNSVAASEWDGQERVNVLMLGVDNRDKDSSPRSDSMMLVSIDPKTNTAALMSIMRDTYVTVPGHGKNKINQAFSIGGPSLAVKTVEDFLQIPVHYYVVTDFHGFEGIVDAIGGVDINVEIPMKHVDDGVYDINLKKGLQHLSGREALQYVRYRGDITADFARTDRQRKLVKAVLAEMKTPLTLVRFPSMLKEAESYVQTNMTATDLMRLSTDLLALDQSSMNAVQVPPNELLTETYNAIGESILQPDVKGVQKFVRETLGEDGKPANSKSALAAGAGAGAGSRGNGGQGVSSGANSGAGSGSGTASLRTGTVTSGVNVRQGPGTNNPILTSAGQGDQVAILGETGGWYKVELQNGTVGYIFGEYVQVR
ncbi:LCP family protein [Effusibacillus consociatus]|uniref:LCP family protein n=1 Tax=Effusibacillus consociatus TaxID=1117041 RepID=A0ABV9PXF9_9BACL